MHHNTNTFTTGNTHIKSDFTLLNLPVGANKTPLLEILSKPGLWVSPLEMCQFRNKEHLSYHRHVTPLGRNTLYDPTLTVFSTWMIKHVPCQCSTLILNPQSKHMQSNFHDDYVLYRLPIFLHLLEQDY